jgi:PAS domain S-box-containing protein
MPSQRLTDPLPWRPEDNAWLRLILVGAPVIAIVGAAIGLVLVPGSSPGFAIAGVLLPSLALVTLGIGLRRRSFLLAGAVLLNVEALAAAAMLPAGIAVAVVLPMISVAVIEGMVQPRRLLQASIAAAVVGTAGAALAILIGPARVLFTETATPVTIACFAGLVAFALALDWRSTNRLRVALAVAQDELVARREAERELARTSEMLSAIVDSSPLATQAFAMDRTVTVWNRASERIFGWTAEEVIGRPMPEAMVPEDERETSAERIRRTIGGEPTRGDRVRRLTKDGRELWIDIYAAVLRDRDGRPIGIAGQLVDVTERVALEAQLAHAERLEAVGRLAGGIAHDFNNTLTAIGGFASLIADESDDQGAVREDAATIVDIVERSGQLTRQLLAFARRTTLLPSVVDIRTTVATVEPTLRRLLDSRVDLQVRLADEPLVARVDAGQLEQAVVNLALNARDAMDEDGRVVVSMRRVRIAAGDVADEPELEGPFVAVALCDTGTGMDPAVAGRAFEPFFTTKDPGRGTGLGLAMVRDFARQSGGTVRLASTPGAGTTVELLFPELVAASADDAPPAAVPARPTGTESILLVDDEPAVAAFARRALTDLGYDVHSANDVQSARRVIESGHHPVDLLLTDVILGDGLGTDLADVVRASRPDAAILFMCGYAGDVLADRGVEVERLDVLTKPFSGLDLAVRVRRALDARPTHHGATPGA